MRVTDALRVLRSDAEDCAGDLFDREAHVCELGAACPYGPDGTYRDDPEVEFDDPDEA